MFGLIPLYSNYFPQLNRERDELEAASSNKTPLGELLGAYCVVLAVDVVMMLCKDL